jgi:succinate-semialdehyde dehydrogenase/glutarate-semialdehyde dehydrogenase
MAAKFRNAGQTCICPNRVYVQQGVYQRFIGKLAEKVGSLTIGPASGGKADIGPLINARALEKVEQHVADALVQGAQLVVGGRRHHCDDAPAGHFFTPTVLSGVTAAMRMSCEETFGPVVPVTPFATEAEVIGLANATPFGLAAYFYSRDIDRIWGLAEAIEAGMVAVNDGALSTEITPFGGIKDSGYGREGSQYGLDDYLNIKTIRHGSLRRIAS